MELSVWKTAHSTVVEMAEREKKAHNAQVATLNRQISVGVLEVGLIFSIQLRGGYLNALPRIKIP